MIEKLNSLYVSIFLVKYIFLNAFLSVQHYLHFSTVFKF